MKKYINVLLFPFLCFSCSQKSENNRSDNDFFNNDNELVDYDVDSNDDFVDEDNEIAETSLIEKGCPEIANPCGTEDNDAICYSDDGNLLCSCSKEYEYKTLLFDDLITDSRHIMLVDNLLYVSDGKYGLVILDLSNPVSPVRVGKLQTDETLLQFDIDSDEKILYSLTDDGKLILIDISDNSNLSVISSVSGLSNPLGIDAANGFAYIADYDFVVFVDVRDRLNPIIINRIEKSSDNLIVNGDYLYISTGVDLVGKEFRNLGIAEISDPETPEFGVDVYFHDQGHANTNSIKIKDNLLIAGVRSLVPKATFKNELFAENRPNFFSHSENVKLVDISDPFFPVPLNPRGIGESWTYPIDYKGNYLFAFDVFDGLFVADLSSTPILKILSVTTRFYWYFCKGLVYHDQYIYLSHGKYLYILDTRNCVKK